MKAKELKNITILCLGSLLLTSCAMDQHNLQGTDSSETASTSQASNTANNSSLAGAFGLKSTTPGIFSESDLWDRIRKGYSLPVSKHERVQREISWFARNQEYLTRVNERASYYLYDIVAEVERRNMPLEIALLPVVESAFQPFAYSHGRASGIWQFIPGTGRKYGLSQTWWYDGRRDIHASTRAALDYLEKLNKDFDGDWMLALAAYNTGEGNVAKAIRKNKSRGKATDFFSLDLPRETRMYVPKLLAIAAIVKDPDFYAIKLDPIPNKPYFQTVTIDSQLDLALAADLANISMEEFYLLNPAFNRWATDPAGPHRILLPVDNVATFEKGLAEHPASERIKWIRHKIKNGEAIGSIARKYNTTVELIRKVNNLRSNSISAGKSLTIPVATQDLAFYSKSNDQRLKSIKSTPRGGEKEAYVVRDGDTLWDISRKYNVSSRQLAKWNGMAPRDTLKVGQTLVVWSGSKKSNSFTNVSLPDAANRKISYRVRSGDSLARIASKFRVSIPDLRSWNKLPEGKHLQPGQILKLFIDVTKQSS